MDDIENILKLNVNSRIVFACTFSLRGKESYENEPTNMTFYNELYQLLKQYKFQIYISKKKGNNRFF